MNKLIAVIVFSIITAWAHAEVQVEIEPSQVALNETFQITLTQNGTQAAGVPNLSILKKEFLILGTARQVSYSVVNGQSSMSNQWVINLKPLRAGILSIPSIKIGSEQSNPMTIHVAQASPQQALTPDDSDLDAQGLALKTSVDTTKPYVNQEIIYTVKLVNSKRLLDAEYEAPKAEDALIIPLGDAKRYQTTQNNVNYVIEEQQYAVFPQKSGVLKINSPRFSALIYDFNPQRVKAKGNDLEIHVQPVPQTFQNQTWLPAKDVRLTEHYENTSQSLAQGSTLVRTITLEGKGIPAQLLPALSFSNGSNFNVYPEKGTDRNQVSQGELIGSTEFKVTYLFNKPGTIVLPEVQVRWFNTQKGKEEIARLAPRSIEVTATTSQHTSSSTPAQTAEPGSTSPVSIATTSADVLHAKNNYWPWLLAGFFACGWLVTVIRGASRYSNRLLGRKAYKKALTHLQHACSIADPLSARDALLAWAALHWPDVTLLTLSDLVHIVRDTQLKKQIHLLSQVLYKKDGAINWQGSELLKAVVAIKPANTVGNKRKKTVLPPINPL